jgi:hypothetical protein
MEKEFIPYKEALELKQLGFDEPCFVYWVFDGVKVTFSTSHNRSGWSMTGFKNNQMDKKAGLCTAPLYQQAFRWFREKYDLWQDISVFVWDYDKNELGFNVRTYLNPFDVNTEKKTHLEVFETYEEAELECLRKLIQIVKDLAIAK